MYSFNSDIDKRLMEFKENLVAYVQSYGFNSELKDFDFSMVLFDAKMALPFNFDELNVRTFLTKMRATPNYFPENYLDDIDSGDISLEIYYDRKEHDYPSYNLKMFYNDDRKYSEELFQAIDIYVTQLLIDVDSFQKNIQKNAYVSLEQVRKSSWIDSYKDEQHKPQTKQTETESNNNWRLPSPEEFISIIDYECQGINGRPNGTIIDELQGYANYWTNKPIIQSGINGRKYAWVFSNINGTQIKKVPVRNDVPIFLICVKEHDGKLIWEQNPLDYPLASEGIQVYLDQINGES